MPSVYAVSTPCSLTISFPVWGCLDVDQELSWCLAHAAVWRPDTQPTPKTVGAVLGKPALVLNQEELSKAEDPNK
jgi:hypothetical protein